MRILIIVFISVAFAAAGCKEKQQAAAQGATQGGVSSAEQSADSLMFYYKRTPCFGTCRTFELSVYSSGYVVFIGKQNVELIGTYHSTWTPAALQRVEQVVNEIEYFRLEDKYDFDGIQDIPSVYTTVNLGGKKKSIHDRYKGPASLERLYQALDELMNESKWIQD